jgi:Cys-rich protein (TIGR01571 family)
MASTHAMLNGRLTPDAMDCICASWPNVEYFTRRRIREVQNIPSDTCTDCLTIIFCLPCSILQDQAEVKNNSAKFMAIGATAAAGRAVGNLAGGMM